MVLVYSIGPSWFYGQSGLFLDYWLFLIMMTIRRCIQTIQRIEVDMKKLINNPWACIVANALLAVLLYATVFYVYGMDIYLGADAGLVEVYPGAFKALVEGTGQVIFMLIHFVELIASVPIYNHIQSGVVRLAALPGHESSMGPLTVLYFTAYGTSVALLMNICWQLFRGIKSMIHKLVFRQYGDV